MATEVPQKISHGVNIPDYVYEAFTPKLTKYIPVIPTDKQAAALLLNEFDDIGYGGAAGGGKSYFLFMAALQYVDVPGYSALIIKNTFGELTLPGGIMDVAREWLMGTDAELDGMIRTWRFPSGAKLSFGYLQDDNDPFHYKGLTYQFIGCDEIDKMPQHRYRYLWRCLRNPIGVNVPLRFRTTFNPDGNFADEPYQYYIVDKRIEREIDLGDYGKQIIRVLFMPSNLNDNPYLDREKYIRSLANLDPITREQLLRGDFTIKKQGNLFKSEWFPIVESAPANCRWVRYWDLAATEEKKGNDPDWTAGCLMGRSADKRNYIKDMRRVRASPLRVERLIHQTAEIDGKETAIYIEQEPGSSGVIVIDHYVREVLQGFNVHGVKSTGSKELRAQPFSAQCEHGNVLLVRGDWIRTFLDELVMFPSKTHDDQVDAASGAFSQFQVPIPRIYISD